MHRAYRQCVPSHSTPKGGTNLSDHLFWIFGWRWEEIPFFSCHVTGRPVPHKPDLSSPSNLPWILSQVDRRMWGVWTTGSKGLHDRILPLSHEWWIMAASSLCRWNWPREGGKKMDLLAHSCLILPKKKNIGPFSARFCCVISELVSAS